MNNEHTTPRELILQLESEFGKFDLDPCANYDIKNQFAKHNYCYGDTRLSRSVWKDCGYTDGLKQKWFGKVFINPPYSQGNIPLWLDKAFDEIENGKPELIVMLLPADSSTRWYKIWFCEQIGYGNIPYYTWNDEVMKGDKIEIRLMPRLNFSSEKNNAKFPSMLVILRK